VNSSGAAASWLDVGRQLGGSDFVGGVGARRAPPCWWSLPATSSPDRSSCRLPGNSPRLPGSHYLFYAALGGFEAHWPWPFSIVRWPWAPWPHRGPHRLLTALVPSSFSLPRGPARSVDCVGLRSSRRHRSHYHAPEEGLCKKEMSTPQPRSCWARSPELIRRPADSLQNGQPSGTMWVMTSARAAGVMAMLLVLVAMPPKGPWRGFWLTESRLDCWTPSATCSIFRPPVWTTRRGRAGLFALPAGTILLAALVLREWPTRRRLPAWLWPRCCAAAERLGASK